MDEARSATWRTAFVVLICGGLIMSLSMGVRQTFGLFLQPMSVDLGWGRETFAFAMAIQNLIWGVSQPFAGMIADRYGAGRVIAVGAVAYAASLYLMSQTGSSDEFNMTAGVAVGFALSGTTFAVVLAAVGRAFPPEKRSFALGITSAGGSFGQFAMVPAGQAFISAYGWSLAMVFLAAVAFLIVPLSAALAGKAAEAKTGARDDQDLRQAIGEAGRHGGFRYLTLGFFVCGFQVVFIGVHLPAYLTDNAIDPEIAALSLGLIGLFNIFGSLGCGYLGGRFSKKYVLSILYLGRSVVTMLFIVLPITNLTVILFACAIGLLWLGTVPLTSGLVAQIFGARYMGTLFGIVFLSHQVGSFLGVWMGGYLYDTTGSYDVVWWLIVVLGVVAALLHWPIDERTVPRLATAAE